MASMPHEPLHVVPNVVSCDHAEPCGGCPLIALTYAEQLAHKGRRVEETCARYQTFDAQVDAVLGAEAITGYRTRAKLVVGAGGRIGLFAKGGTHQLVDIPGCRVLSAPIARVVDLLRTTTLAAERSGGIMAPSASTAHGALRAIDVRDIQPPGGAAATATAILLTLVLERRRVHDLDRFREAATELMAKEPSIRGVAASLHDGESPQILGDELVVLAGVTSLVDRVGLSSHHASHGAFVQAHRDQTGKVHRILTEAIGALGPAPRVLDLYGGAGAISMALGKMGAQVHLVEAFAPAVEQARAAAREQNIELTAEAENALVALRALAAAKRPFEAVVANPPRRGMSPLVRELIAVLGPSRIAYVSCDPDTLVRDLDHFARLGYRAGALRPIDMIPLTEEVESVTILERGEATLPRVLHEEADILVVEKSAHEPTVPQGEYLSSLMTRVRRLPNAERATPVHRLDVGTSGLVLFVRTPESAPMWANGASCRRVYLAAVRGVPPMKGAVTRDLRENGVRYPARTRYRRLAALGGHGMIRAVPEVPRTHQVRRHLAAAGHPILGDDRYGHGPTNRYFEERHTLDRTFLHCVRLELTHPQSGARLVVEAPLPGDLCTVLHRLGGSETLRFLEQKNALGGFTSMPPPPTESESEADSPLDIEFGTPTLRPEPITGDDT